MKALSDFQMRKSKKLEKALNFDKMLHDMFT